MHCIYLEIHLFYFSEACSLCWFMCLIFSEQSTNKYFFCWKNFVRGHNALWKTRWQHKLLLEAVKGRHLWCISGKSLNKMKYRSFKHHFIENKSSFYWDGGFDSLKISESISVHVEHIHHLCFFVLRPFLHKLSEHNWFSRRQKSELSTEALHHRQEKPRATFQLVGAAWNNVLLDLVSRVLHFANGLEKDWEIWP